MKKSSLYNVLLFLGFLFVEISETFTNVSFLQNKLTYIKMLGIIILTFLSLLVSFKMERKKLFLVFVLIILSLLIFFRFGNGIFLEMVVMILAVQNKKFKRIVKIDLFVKLFIVASLFIFSKCGLTNGIFETINRENVIRYSLGFYHPNTLGMYLMMISIEFLYVMQNKKKFRNVLIMIIMSFIIYKVTYSRTCVYCLIGLSLIYIAPQYVEKKTMGLNKKIYKFLSKNIYIIFLISTCLISLLYCEDSATMQKLNELTNNRILYQSYFINHYGISFFGKNIDYIYTLDNGYLKIFLNYGLIISVLLIHVFRNNIEKTFKNKNVLLLGIYVIISFYCLSESYLFYSTYNIFWLYFFTRDEGEHNEIVNNNTSL